MQTAKQILETIKLRCELDLCGLSENELIEAIDDVIQANQSQRILELEMVIEGLIGEPKIKDICGAIHESDIIRDTNGDEVEQ